MFQIRTPYVSPLECLPVKNPKVIPLQKKNILLILYAGLPTLLKVLIQLRDVYETNFKRIKSEMMDRANRLHLSRVLICPDLYL